MLTLKTDYYEYSMLSAFIESGMAEKQSTFELFARKLPKGRRFGIVAGLGRFLDSYQEWTITEEDLQYLTSNKMVTEKTEEWLTNKIGRPLFTGDIYAYPEGSLYSPLSPVVRVQGKLGECILLETILLSMLNHDTAVASAAVRMVLESNGRQIIEMGSRRTEDQAAISAARAAYIAGFASTSNLQAGKTYGIPVKGTAAHAFTLAHSSEEEAFRNQIKTWGTSTTLLVDTYDTTEGIRNAVKVAREFGASGPGAIRIDSGDLIVETQKARKLLDNLGATKTKIVVSSDLDEYLMSELTPAPIDGYGVGTRVVTGSGHPTAGMVYKLVEIEGRKVAKKSKDKGSVGGVKTPYLTETGEEKFSLDGMVRGRSLQVLVVKDGVLEPRESLDRIRERVREELLTLPESACKISDGEPFRICKWDGVE